ncbi:MAG: cell division protein ZapA, partial [Oscillospiraceae bacterium]
NDSLSITGALMLVALDYLDSLKKSEQNADNIRSQLTEYMNDSGKSLGELNSLKRENEKLRKRLEGKKDAG